MTNLAEILHLLDEQVIYEKIDTPIDEILNKYPYSVSEEITQKEFISIIYSFISQLKESGSILSIDSVSSNDFSEVFLYLEKYYRDGDSLGYERALNDYGEYGIEMIIEETCESLKMELRERYLNWVYDTRIIYLPWPDKLDLMEEFTEQYILRFLPTISSLPKEQLISFMKELLSRVVKGKEVVKSRIETKLFNK